MKGVHRSPPLTQATSPCPAIQVICSPGGQVQVIVKKVDFPQNKPQQPPLWAKPSKAQVSLPMSLVVPLTLPLTDTTPCVDPNSQCDIPLPQLTKFMQTAAAGEFSKIKYLFPKFNLDRNYSTVFSSEPDFALCLYQGYAS